VKLNFCPQISYNLIQKYLKISQEWFKEDVYCLRVKFWGFKWWLYCLKYCHQLDFYVLPQHSQALIREWKFVWFCPSWSPSLLNYQVLSSFYCYSQSFTCLFHLKRFGILGQCLALKSLLFELILTSFSNQSLRKTFKLWSFIFASLQIPIKPAIHQIAKSRH